MLGMDYNVIHASPNNCILYHDDHPMINGLVGRRPQPLKASEIVLGCGSIT